MIEIFSSVNNVRSELTKSPESEKADSETAESSSVTMLSPYRLSSILLITKRPEKVKERRNENRDEKT